jgi:hypothetical protein
MQQQMKCGLASKSSQFLWPAMPMQQLGKSTKPRVGNEQFKPLNCLSLATLTILSPQTHEPIWNA